MTTTWTLAARPPFSLDAVMGSHGWMRLAPFGQDEATGGLTRLERLESGCVVSLLIQDAGDSVCVEATASLSQAEREEASRKVRWMLGLDQDLSGFYAVAREEPKLAHVPARAQGRLLRSPTLFEDVIKTILTTNTTWTGTIRMAEALVAHYGDPWPSDPERRAFPTAEQLATSDEGTLRSEARLGYRAPYVLALARSLVSGERDLEPYKTSELPTDQLRKHLLAIKGVGNYAAANLLMILGRYDNIPVDSWALKMVSHEWHGGEPVGPDQVEAAFERWGPWKGLAYWFWDWSYKG